MTEVEIREALHNHLSNEMFPCVAAKAALAKGQLEVFVADHMACPKDDRAILEFIYNFTDKFRESDKMFQSAAVVFRQPDVYDEQLYARFFWSRLQALADLDAAQYHYDARVSPDVHSENFSFSLKEEAYFIVGLHPAASRPARRFAYPALVFNPHAQFEKLRETGQYQKLQNIIRKKDAALAGDINPMLRDFGDASEAWQYTGQQLANNWKCPLDIHHDPKQHHQSA